MQGNTSGRGSGSRITTNFTTEAGAIIVTFDPPDFQEPEQSFFPDPTKCNTQAILQKFPEHMDTFLSLAENPRNYREYPITFTLTGIEREDSQGRPYNFRMRAYLQPLADGRIIFSNWQFTAKTRGNAKDRLEIQTDDNLPSGNIIAALESLKQKYGADLPSELANINPQELYVDSVLINSRIGKNGDLNSGGVLIPHWKALTMVNSDNVLFFAPQILDDKGELLLLDSEGRKVRQDDWEGASRPELEVEIQKVAVTLPTTQQQLFQYRVSNGKPTINNLQSLFDNALHQVSEHAAQIVPAEIVYLTGKVDEAQDRSGKFRSLAVDWQTASDRWRHRMQPSDYERPEMQDALRAIIATAPSPHGIHHDDEIVRRTKSFGRTLQQGKRTLPRSGYEITLSEGITI